MRSQKGFSLLGLLIVVVIVVIVFVLAVPRLSRSDKRDEAGAVLTLKQIHAAQADLYGAGMMYGPLGKLTNSKLLDSGFTDSGFTRFGYRFLHSTSGNAKRWCAEAVPEGSGGGRTLAIDESGRVLAGPAGCYNGVLDTTGGVPVK